VRFIDKNSQVGRQPLTDFTFRVFESEFTASVGWTTTEYDAAGNLLKIILTNRSKIEYRLRLGKYADLFR
jgi:hypothetical protein